MIVNSSYPGLGTRMKMSEDEFKAEIAAAEERGRASAAAAQPAVPVTAETKVAVPSAPIPTKEQEAAMVEIQALKAKMAADAAVANDPKLMSAKITAHIAAEAAKGRRIGFALAASEIANAR